MNRHCFGRWAGGLAALVCVVLATVPGRAAPQLESDFKADEAIQTITVKIEVGAGGADLDEAVALDLGLGFPLWLHPLGRPENTTAPFGAVPQEGPAGGPLAAGAGATFTFSLTAEPGQDVFLTTPQLLADVRVSDISRVGLASRGEKDWILDGFEVQINGKAFAEGKSLGQKAKQAQDTARAKLADVDAKINPLLAERATLDDFVKAQLATEADTKRLAEIDTELAPLAEQKYRLERQLQGKSPWFEDSQFASPWRDKSLVRTARVTLITRSHTAADTRNYIYFIAGGHKYLIASPTAPLSSARSPQVIPIDLVAGPLSAADLRGWGVGMLAPADPFDRAPDRWHPERILVEIDNRAAYDSDENPIDRESLKAIRLIPPVHVDQEGMLVTNTPIDRETFVWQAGKGLGLDVASGQSLPLPPADDPAYPPAEPGTMAGEPSEGAPLEDGSEAFPGETPEDWGDTGAGGGYWPPGEGGAGCWPMDDGFGGAGSDAVDLLAWLWLLLHDGGLGPIFPPGEDPAPAGEPFQIKEGSVFITSGLKADDQFTIQWDVVGDENEIDHYEVSLVEIYPERPVFLGGTLLADSVAVGSRQYSGPLQAAKPAEVHYLAPVVVAIPKDPVNQTPHQRMGPARVVFPPAVGILFPTTQLRPFFSGDLDVMPPMAFMDPVSWGGPLPEPNHSVWPALGVVESHAGIFFDHPVSAWNVGARLAANDASLTVPFTTSAKLPAGKYRIVAHLGFSGGMGGTGTATVDVKYTIRSDQQNLVFPPPQPFEFLDTLSIVGTVGDVPQPMTLVSWVIDTADAVNFLPPYDLDITFAYKGPPTDAAYPPTLFGVRLLPEH